MAKVDLSKHKSRFSNAEKFKRIIWDLVWSCVTTFPRQGSFLRVWTLRCFGAKIGKKCLIDRGVKVWMPWNLELSDFVAIGRYVEIYNYDKIFIGTMSVVSQYCYLCTGTHDYTKTHLPLIWYPIYIGNSCWLCAGTWVLPGVSIGEGTVIGAYSLVTKDMPPWMVCAGNPCKPIKKRILTQ